MRPRVTLRDLAKITGLHFTTVGLALRKYPRLSPTTVATVVAAAKQHGYQRDPMLSALASYRHRKARPFRGGVLGFLTTSPLCDALSANFGVEAAYVSAKPLVEELGFKLECFDLTESGVTGRRLTQILSARGIEGLLLAPLPVPAPYLNLEWQKFCAVAMGYSILAPALHRACFHQARSMQILLRELRRLGYRRIGLTLSVNADRRTDHNLVGAYLAEQRGHVEAATIPPHIIAEPTREAFAQWLRAERPDCVIGTGGREYSWLLDLGYAVPEDIGYTASNWCSSAPHIAGIEEGWSMLGVTAVELLVGLLKARKFGLPSVPHFAMIEGQWRAGQSLRTSTHP